MRLTQYTFLAMALLLAAWFSLSPARSASFDCAQASHPLEKAICANPALSKLDSDMASLYRDKLAIIFDRLSLKGQQREWQQILRVRCTKSCDAAAVKKEYVDQIASLKRLNTETYEASYKTADVSTLTIRHLDARQFDFDIVRDLEGKKLCALPADDGEAGAIATLSSPVKATWRAGACTIDFALTRDSSGNVSRIDVAASAGCKRYCQARNYGLSDVYLPSNNWVAGNQ